MKVIPNRTNLTSVRCILEGPELNALLSEAAAKASEFDLAAPNVKVERVQVLGVDYSQNRSAPRAIVDLVMFHDPRSLSEWTPEPGPPEPPPTTQPARFIQQRRWWPFVTFYGFAIVVGVIWALGGFDMK